MISRIFMSKFQFLIFFFREVVSLGEEAHLNTSFKHFIYFVQVNFEIELDIFLLYKTLWLFRITYWFDWKNQLYLQQSIRLYLHLLVTEQPISDFLLKIGKYIFFNGKEIWHINTDLNIWCQNINYFHRKGLI